MMDFGANENCKRFLEGDLLRKISDGCYDEFGTRLDEVVGLSRWCNRCGMVEQTDVPSGINYDDWILIGASCIGIEGRCTSRLKSLTMLDDGYTNDG
ncbi:hypothetical protein A2U01_0048444, partial [Trifolium medium]|nr:hypothetical protein [Trifolium medium]